MLNFKTQLGFLRTKIVARCTRRVWRGAGGPHREFDAALKSQGVNAKKCKKFYFDVL